MKLGLKNFAKVAIIKFCRTNGFLGIQFLSGSWNLKCPEEQKKDSSRVCTQEIGINVGREEVSFTDIRRCEIKI